MEYSLCIFLIAWLWLARVPHWLQGLAGTRGGVKHGIVGDSICSAGENGEKPRYTPDAHAGRSGFADIRM
jgi:hypothetical protein